MKRKVRVIQISGLRGLLTVVFIVSCLTAGFAAFPAFVAMCLWNYVAEFIAIPAINIFQGLMLWAIIAISGFIINDRKKFLIAFRAHGQLTEQEMRNVMERIKMQSQAQVINSLLLKSGDIKSVKKEENSNKEKENI